MRRLLLFFGMCAISVLQAQHWLSVHPVPSAQPGLVMHADEQGNVFTVCGGKLSCRDGAYRLLWERSFQLPARAVFVTAENLYVVGASARSAGQQAQPYSEQDTEGYVSAYDLAGNFRWLKRLKGEGINEISSVCAYGNGSVLVSLFSEKGAFFDGFPVQKGASVIQLGASGIILRAHTVSHKNGIGRTLKVQADVEGNLYLLGSYSDTLFAGGQTKICSSPYYGMYYLLKMDRSGVLVWFREMESCFRRSIRSFAVTDAQEIFIPVCFVYGADQLIKLGPDGTEVWRRPCGGTTYGEANGIALGADGGVYLAGSTWVNADFGDALLQGEDQFLFAAKFSSEGKRLWALKAQSSGNSSGVYICANKGRVIVGAQVPAGGSTQMESLNTDGYNLIALIQEEEAASAAVQKEAENTLLLYPNPSGGLFFIKDRKSCDYAVYTEQGVLVAQGRAENGNLNLGHLSPGIYIIRLRTGSASQRIIIH